MILISGIGWILDGPFSWDQFNMELVQSIYSYVAHPRSSNYPSPPPCTGLLSEVIISFGLSNFHLGNNKIASKFICSEKATKFLHCADRPTLGSDRFWRSILASAISMFPICFSSVCKVISVHEPCIDLVVIPHSRFEI